MTSFLSKRLLINLAIVAAAVGANAFIAYTQIRAQRELDARTMESTAIRHNLDAYRELLDSHLALLGRFEASGQVAAASAAASLDTALSGLESTLHGQLAGDPQMLRIFGELSADGRSLQREIVAALARTADPAASDGSRAWAAETYTRLGMESDRIESELAALRQHEDRALETSLANATRNAQHATLLLIVTMLAGGTLLIYTFGARENSARERIRLAGALRRNDERFRGLFDDHPVPMYIFDRETLRFLAVNTAAVQQYGYTETEFLGMTVRAIRPSSEVPRLESHLQRSEAAPRTGRTMAGIWHHKRRDGSQISANISYHALTFMGRAALFVLADDVTDQINAEAEAQRSNQMLETVMDNIPQRIFWKDRESRYLGCNMAFARDAGLAYPEQVVGKTDDDLPWREIADEVRRHDAEVIESGVPKMNYEFDMIVEQAAKALVVATQCTRQTNPFARTVLAGAERVDQERAAGQHRDDQQQRRVLGVAGGFSERRFQRVVFMLAQCRELGVDPVRLHAEPRVGLGSPCTRAVRRGRIGRARESRDDFALQASAVRTEFAEHALHLRIA
ncbi:MAG TPA: PAS domain S-box protein, partial [Paraburkholderia sp.]|nr:PAS domain S-box protein [Paraburkholderia sp.]